MHQCKIAIELIGKETQASTQLRPHPREIQSPAAIWNIKLLGHASLQTTELYLSNEQDLGQAVNDHVKIRLE